MLQSSLKVTRAEKDLLETCREMRFGEVYGLELTDDNSQATEVIPVSAQERDFVISVRSGLTKIDILHVHFGQPVLAEVDYKSRGFRCRKKVKFPTEQTEGLA